MHEIEERLYGMDCGSCGAPSCKALAEDVVRGFAEENACIFKLRDEMRAMADGLTRLARALPRASNSEDSRENSEKEKSR